MTIKSRAIVFAMDNPGHSSTDCANAIGLRWETVSARLKEAVDDGLLSRKLENSDYFKNVPTWKYYPPI